MRQALLLLTVVGSLPAFGAVDPERFTNLSLDDGLSQSTVYAIAQDARGFMWLGTEDGLNRFDGYEFTVYRSDPDVAGSLGNNTVYDLLRARDGTLWIGTWGAGLERYRPESDSFFAYRHDPADETTLSHDMVFEIFEDSAGDLWLGTLGGGLNRLDTETGRFQRFVHDPGDPKSLSGDRVVAITEDSAGVLWVGTDGAGLNRLDPETGLFDRFRSSGDPATLGSDRVFALLEDRSGELWVGTHGGGLNRLDRTTGRFERFRHDPADPRSLSSDQVLSIGEDRAGRLWVGTGVIWTAASGSGLNRFHPETGDFSHYRHDPGWPASLASDELLSIFEDASGLLWLGTNGAGVSRFHPGEGGFPHFRSKPLDPNSLSDNIVYGMHEDAHDFIWIATSKGLNRFDPRSHTFRHYRHDPADASSLPNDVVNTIFEDSRRNLWVGTAAGLTRMERSTAGFQRVSLGPGLAGQFGGNEVQTIAEDGAGLLWMGTFSGGVLRLEPETGELARYLHDPEDPESLANNNVSYILEDSRGTLWVGTEGGLDLLDRETGRFQHFRNESDRADSLGGNDVICVYESRAGDLWVGTYGGGLNLLDRPGGTFTRYTTRDGLPNDSIYGILEDDRGRLWLSTNNGLSRFDPRRGVFKNYDVSDGLQSDEFDTWAFHQTSDGKMLFGGINGFNFFDPSRITVNTHRPPLALTSFKIFNREARAHGPAAEIRAIEVPYRENVLSFEFAALDYTAPEKNEYAYRLEGFDQAWVESGTIRTVTYTNLNPGRYVFQVRGANSDGVWNDDALEVPLVVVPLFWMTGWFRALAALGVVLVALAVYGLRTRSIRRRSRELSEINRQLGEEVAQRRRAQRELEAKNAELERFTYTVSHDLKSPLVTIKGFAGFLERDAEAGDSGRVRHGVARINKAADKMARLLNDLLELSRIGQVVHPPEAVSLTELAREAAGLVAGRIEERGVAVGIDPAMPVVVGDRVRLLEVFQNLLDNAVSYMGDQQQPRVEIDAEEAGDEVVCRVRDNGVGIEAQYHAKIFELFERLNAETEGTGVGLALIARIVEAHGGRIWVESEGAGRGSTFCFSLPRVGSVARASTPAASP